MRLPPSTRIAMTPRPRFRRILLKLSGEVLMGEGGLTPLMEKAVAAAHRRAKELGAK